MITENFGLELIGYLMVILIKVFTIFQSLICFEIIEYLVSRMIMIVELLAMNVLLSTPLIIFSLVSPLTTFSLTVRISQPPILVHNPWIVMLISIKDKQHEIHIDALTVDN